MLLAQQPAVFDLFLLLFLKSIMTFLFLESLKKKKVPA